MLEPFLAEFPVERVHASEMHDLLALRCVRLQHCKIRYHMYVENVACLRQQNDEDLYELWMHEKMHSLRK